MPQEPDRVDQNLQRRLQYVAERIAACADLMARDAAVVASWRWHNGQKLGPYWRIAYRDRGRQKSIYLGRSDALAERARRLLDGLRQPQRERKDWLRLQAEARAELSRHKKLWERELHARGLYTRGYAVYGFRRLGRLANGRGFMAARCPAVRDCTFGSGAAGCCG